MYADDIVLVLEGSYRRQLEEVGNHFLETITEWVCGHHLRLNTIKSYCLLLIKSNGHPIIWLDSCHLQFVPKLKILDVIFDDKLFFSSFEIYEN